MSIDSVEDWSTTAALNTSLGALSTQGSASANTIDNIVREMMAQIATWSSNGLPGITAIVHSAASNFTIGPSTADGSDDRSVWLLGGSSGSATRGGMVIVHGNEYSGSAGQVRLIAGAAALGDDAVHLEGDTTITGALVVTGGLAISGATGVTALGQITSTGGHVQSYLAAAGATPSIGCHSTDRSTNLGFWNSASSTIAFGAMDGSGVPAASWGAMDANGINFGGQLSFPTSQNASANANSFDDYEEGTFTPTIIGLSTAGAGTYSFQDGKYTKVGNRVLFSARCTWSAHTGTGVFVMGGLPFASGSGSSYPVALAVSDLTMANQLFGYIVGTQAYITFGTAATGANFAFSSIEAAADIIASGQYNV